MPERTDAHKDEDGITIESGERVSLYLYVRFLVEDREEAGRGVVRSYSQEEVSFLTRENLEPGVDLRIGICTTDRAHTTCTVMRRARVVETKLDRDEVYLVRTALLPGDGAAPDVDVVNRRQHGRRSLGIRGLYRREHEAQFRPCRLLDISSGGIRFRAHAPVKKFERLFVQSRGATGGALKRMVSAEIQVMWSRHIGGGEYETGGKFLTVQLRETGEDAADDREEPPGPSSGREAEASDPPPDA